MNKLKAVFILGADCASTPGDILDQLKQLYQKPGYLIIGDGINNTNLKEISSLTGKIDSNTRIDIHAHGDIYNHKHIVMLGHNVKTHTSNLFTLLDTQNLGNPLYINLWSCYGGAAAKDIEYLSEGSVLVAHGTNTQTIVKYLEHPALFEIISKLDNVDNSISFFQKVINELAIYSREPFSVITSIKNQVHEFKVNYNLEEALRDPVKLLTQTHEKFAEFYHNLHPNLENLKLPEILDSQGLDSYRHGILIYKSSSISPENINQITTLLQDKNKKHLYENLLNIKIGNDITPLYISCYVNNIQVSKLLLSAGADPNIAAGDTDETPLLMASQEGYMETVTLLLNNGADPDIARKYDGATPLWMALQERNTDIVQLLLVNKANPNIALKSGMTPLLMASHERYSEAVTLLLKHNADPNIANADEITPLLHASHKSYKEIVKLLLKHGADLYTKHQGFTILEWVKEFNDKKLIEIFNQEINERTLISANLPNLSKQEATDYLSSHNNKAYSAKKCSEYSKAIYKFADDLSDTLICEYQTQPQQHEEL